MEDKKQKQLYRAIINGNEEATQAYSEEQAKQLLRIRAKKKYGNYDVSDFHHWNFEKKSWDRISYGF